MALTTTPTTRLLVRHEHFRQVVRQAAPAPFGDLFLMEEKWRIPLVTALPQSWVGLEILLLDTQSRRLPVAQIRGLLGSSGSRWGSWRELGAGGAADWSSVASNQWSWPNVFQQFVADRPTHAVENHQQHPVIGLRNLGDDLFEHILHPEHACRLRPNGTPVRKGYGECLVEFRSPLGHHLVKSLVSCGEFRTCRRLGRSTPVPNRRKTVP